MDEKKTTDQPDSTQDLTPEERAELETSLPALIRALESNSPAGRAWLASWRVKKSIGAEARDQARDIRQDVLQGSTQEQQDCLATWMGYPTDMTRCSPFFPMNVRDTGKREYLENYLITSAGWGEIRYTGPKLSTYEEDVLMVLLAVIDDQSQHRETTEVEDRKTYTYRGPALPLLRLLGHDRPGKTNYTRLLSALKRLTVAGLDMQISGGKTKSGKQRPPRKTYMSAMLSGAYWDDDKKELSATINPFFYETYMAGTVTLYDVAKRIELHGVIAKALYRFVQSHRKNPVFQGHYLTLGDSLNMDREQPAKKTREHLRTAINELIKHGILTKKSKFVSQDIIILERADGALPKAGSIKAITS